MEWLDEDNKDDFDVDITNSLDEFFESFLLPHPKVKHIEVTLLGHCILHNVYGKEIVWYVTYIHLSHSYEQLREQYEKQKRKPKIYHAHMGYGMKSGWYETVI